MERETVVSRSISYLHPATRNKKALHNTPLYKLVKYRGCRGQCPLRGGSTPTPRTAPKWVPLYTALF